VKFFIRDNDDKEVTLATGNYTNGGFTIIIPDYLPIKYLAPVEDIASTVEISNTEVNIAKGFYIQGFDKDNKYVTTFFYGKKDGSTTYSIDYVYADSEVDISGTGVKTFTYEDDEGLEVEVEENYDFSLKLKKGWNNTYIAKSKTYENDTEVWTIEITSSAVEGYKWYSGDDW